MFSRPLALPSLQTEMPSAFFVRAEFISGLEGLMSYESIDMDKSAAESSYSLFEAELTLEFGILRDLQYLLESQLIENFDEGCKNLAIEAGIEEDGNLRNALYSAADELEQRGEQFKSMLFNSLFSTSFALFEHKIMLICERIQRNVGTPFSVDDLRGGSPLNRAKRYLETVGVDFPNQGSGWKELNNFQQIRNKIMHEGGSVGTNVDLAKFANEKQIISGLSNKQLRLNREFCEAAIDILETFILKVGRACESWRRDTTQ